MAPDPRWRNTPSLRGPRAIEAELVPIRDALEVAFVVARRDRRDPTSPAPPRVLAPILGFAQLPERALDVLRDALDSDATFRDRVLDHADVDALDEGARLFLVRPEGWQGALEALVEEESQRARAEDQERRYHEATEQILRLSESNDELRAERDQLASAVAEQRRNAEARAEASEVLQAELAEALDALGELRAERTEAVRQLKDQESLAQRRLERQRELEESLRTERDAARIRADEEPEAGTRPASGEQTGADGAAECFVRRSELEQAAAPIGAVTAKLAELADAMGDLAALVGSLATEPSHRTGAGLPPDPRGDEPAPADSDMEVPQDGPRRRPVRLGRGLDSDSVEGLDALLGYPGAVVMVDGYNVSMHGWSNLSIAQQRESLITAVGSLQPRGGARWHLVFDGAEQGARPAVSAPLPVRVHFTPAGVEADDRLLEFVDQASRDAPVVVISSDNRVREGARRRGANVVSSGTLLALLRRS